ncbi:MAG: S-adenosylmethionine:tRNA ribosyltransferase-isomerase, partial [Planctomycetota bacterium]
MLSTDQLDYELPQDRIATRPAIPRESARLLVTHRADPTRITHAHVRDLPSLLHEGDLLVRNTTTVIAARLHGTRADSGGRISGLFLESLAPDTWRCLLKANSRLRAGIQIALTPREPSASPLRISLTRKNDDASWIVTLEDPPSADITHLLDSLGLTPLPPYILAARRQHQQTISDDDDRAWYHTVFEDRSTIDDRGASVAAPTAGLHLTEPLLEQLASNGIAIEDVVLHVGEGTFKPVETENLEDHPMHEERFLVPQRTLEAIGRTRQQV